MKTANVWELAIASLSVMKIVIDYYKENVDEEIANKLEDAYYEIMRINNEFYETNIKKS